jgi:hypothetical protein
VVSSHSSGCSMTQVSASGSANMGFPLSWFGCGVSICLCHNTDQLLA